ncbi:MAG: flagellar basal body rod protein FlgC [Candidatus Hydrogenedentes bacterium]|nr:flagellar basal body rod protein FlgC [Candidatus Hydrogenedentota bacterium]
MSEISAFDIAKSGLKAERLRMTIIANNVANAETTRTERGGGPFRRQIVEFIGYPLNGKFPIKKYGVEVKRISYDMSPFKEVYEPGHPDANENGIVKYPNVNVPVEMADLISAQRAYEANISVLVATRQIRQRALEILQR